MSVVQRHHRSRFLLAAATVLSTTAFAQDARLDDVPGVVIHHLPSAGQLYVGSPSIAHAPDGRLVASCDEFGPRAREDGGATRSLVFRSADDGASWARIATIRGSFWANLFVHRGALWLCGTDDQYGSLVIRRSDDGGATWTEPRDAQTGLLRADGRYHTAPVPVVVHRGRIWRACEDAMGPGGWGSHFRAFVMSAPVDADLLDARAWTFTDALPRDPAWLAGAFGGWLEGNAVVAPDGTLVDLLRVHVAGGGRAAICTVSDDGAELSFDPAHDFVAFPGGAKKFTVRRDPDGPGYWTLTNWVPPRFEGGDAERTRNTQLLAFSTDLRTWEPRAVALHHPDRARHGFQYVDWIFDGDDLLAVSRTAHDDGLGGAHNQHDANLLTFHRIEGFRRLRLRPGDPLLSPLTIELGAATVVGGGFEGATLDDGERAFRNRDYVWNSVPDALRGSRITRVDGGGNARIEFVAVEAATLHVATAGSLDEAPGFEPTGWTFRYTDRERTVLQVYVRPVAAGERLTIPQRHWTGTLVIARPR